MPFVEQNWIDADTKMLTTRIGNMYIAHGNEVYRYNPINQRVQALTTSLPGEIGMLALDVDEEVLTVGVEGALYRLDIRTGKNGELLEKIEGIPGVPVGIVERN